MWYAFMIDRQAEKYLFIEKCGRVIMIIRTWVCHGRLPARQSASQPVSRPVTGAYTILQLTAAK